MKRLDIRDKWLYTEEVVSIYCNRRGISMDQFHHDMLRSDAIVKYVDAAEVCLRIRDDLMRYGFEYGYTLKEVTQAEYETCLDQYGIG